MKPTRLPGWEEVVPLLQIAGDLSIPLELCVLKFHLVVELTMYRLLALRLDIEEKSLPPLPYFQLTKLALGGLAGSSPLVKVLALNDLRNEFSHELSVERLEPAYAALAAKAKMFWPEVDVPGKPKEFVEAREVAVRWGAYSCVTDVFCALSDLAMARPDFPPEDLASALQTTARIRETVEATRKSHATLRALFSDSSA
jgi:hypothetical protein